MSEAVESGSVPEWPMAVAVLAPMTAMARRLRLGGRMIALSVVLLIPTGVLGQAFLSTTNGQISFAQRERDGVPSLRPALTMLAQVVAGQQVDLGALTAAVQAHPDLAPGQGRHSRR